MRITAVEIGAELVEEARRNLSMFPDVHVEHGAFENWQPPGACTFDMVFAATAWKWIDPAVRYHRAWELLRPGGHLASWSATHVFHEDGDMFFDEIEAVYEEIGEALSAGITKPGPGELPCEVSEIEGSGLFRPVLVREFDWEVEYGAEAYVQLLDTFSSHMAMKSWQRKKLSEEIWARLARRPSGTLRRGWGAVLHVAERIDDPRR